MTCRFEDLATAATEAGLAAVDRGGGHWQVRGGVHLVNFYPLGTKGPTLYVAGSGSGKRLGGTAREIIAAVLSATEAPPRRPPVASRRRKSTVAAKRRLFAKDRRCHWCRKPLALRREDAVDGKRFATLEHKVPLAAGGLDQPNNWTLACEDCNHGRGDSTAAPQATTEGRRTNRRRGGQ